MRNGSVAEVLLALFTSPDRALSIAGDLREQAPSRFRGWFWLQIAWTAGALFWQDLRDAPLRISGLVVAGWIAHHATVLYVAIPLAQFLGWRQPFDFSWEQEAAWLMGVLLFGLVLVPFLFGLAIGRFSGGRPMTVCIAFALIGQNLLTSYFIHGYWISMGDMAAAEKIAVLLRLQLKGHAFVNAVVAVPMLAAGYLYRRRALRQGTA